MLIEQIHRGLVMVVLSTALWDPTSAQLPPGFQQQAVLPNLGQCIAMEFLPDGRLLVCQKDGMIWITDNSSYTTFNSYMLLGNLEHGQERGLMNIVLDPGFSSNGHFYLYYSAASPAKFRVSRFTHQENSGGTTSTASTASEVVIWEDPQVYSGCCHFGGGMDIGPDGMIYLTTGEGANSNNPQDLTNALGKVLRMQLDGTAPVDNPFNDGAGPQLDHIWAYGLRNPYRACWDPAYNKFYVADVGGSNQGTAQEDLHVMIAGGNAGWPYCEGTNCTWPGGNAPGDFVPPIHSYGHQGPPDPGGAIIGGVVHRGGMFPSNYQGAYFKADYVQNWIKYLTLDVNGSTVISSNMFHSSPGRVVEMEEAPDGSLFFCTIDGVVTRISYSGAVDQPPSCVSAGATPSSGSVPLMVNLSAVVNDPENTALNYTWHFGDGATSSGNLPAGIGDRNLPAIAHTYNSLGTYTAYLTLNDGVNTMDCGHLQVQVGGVAPTAQITQPSEGYLFRADDHISFIGSGSDPNGTLSPANYSWEIVFVHNTHTHPHLGPESGYTSGLLHIPYDGHDFTGNTAYEIRLTVTDQEGLQAHDTVRIYPEKVQLSFTSAPPGVTINIDGIPHVTPFVLEELIGFHHWVQANNGCIGGTNYGFQGWSNGGAQLQQIITPTSNASYHVTMANWGSCPQSDDALLDLRMILEGPYDPMTGLMNDDMRASGILPQVEPYTMLGFPVVGGGEAAPLHVFNSVGNDAVVDWVLIELRDKDIFSNIIASRCGLLQRDGDVVDVDGSSPLAFDVPDDEYYIAVRHRNHLGALIWNKRSLSPSVTSVDLTSINEYTFNTDGVKILNGKQVLWAGNVDMNNELKYTGIGNDRDPILTRVGGSVPTNTVNGYYVEDVDLDGTVKYTGIDNDRDPILINIGGSVPTATRQQQLP